MTTFDILHDPWLDVVRTDGKAQTLPLRDLLTTAHEVARLSESSPLTEVGFLRFLIALISDGLCEQVRSEEDWDRLAHNVNDGLSRQAVDAILAPFGGGPDVLDTAHGAFFDGPDIRRIPGWDDPKARQPASCVLPEVPTRTNLAHFAHTSDATSAVCVGCLLKGRAVESAFARGGLGPTLSRNLLATIGGTEPRYVIPTGRTLLETLALNLIVGDPSQPSWRSIHRRADGDPGSIARLTWRPRLIMPVTSSLTDLPCVRCGTMARPRFAQIVTVDTYNRAGSPFGSKNDVEQWKKLAGDPHLLPVEKGAITLGLSSAEWPLRAVARVLLGGTTVTLDKLQQRAAAIGERVVVSVTSSAGNQAKIDDAPHADLAVPSALLSRSGESREETAAAIMKVFQKGNHSRRLALIPAEVPRLLRELATTDDPDAVVKAWLDSARLCVRASAELPSFGPLASVKVGEPLETGDSVREAAKKLIRRLARLSPQQVAALRPLGKGGAPDDAGRQAAFEAVWHEVRLPAGTRRHAFREALAVIAPVYAVHGDRHRDSRLRGSFEALLRREVRSERIRSGKPAGATSLGRAVAQAAAGTALPGSPALLRLVDVLVHRRQRPVPAIDFVALLSDVALWNDPVQPTRERWWELLKPHSRLTR